MNLVVRQEVFQTLKQLKTNIHIFNLLNVSDIY